MIFSELQTRFTYKTLDDSSEFVWTSTKGKFCINEGYKNCYNKAIIDNTIREMIKTDKTTVTISNKIWTLPSDFYQLHRVYDSTWYNEIDKDVFKYRIKYVSWVYTIVFEILDNTTIKIEYIKPPTEMVNNTDTPAIPDNLHDSILDFALAEYFKMQRDFNWVANSLQLADTLLNDIIWQIWNE